MIVSTKPDFFTSPNWSYQRKLHEVAAAFEHQGYEVEFAPPPYKLPDFLNGFYPDFVAIRGSEHVVVEVKSASKVRPASYWYDLATVIKQHQADGWRFKSDIDHQPAEISEGVTLEDIERQLGQAETHQKGGQITHSMLLTWPAVEAAMRWAVDANQVEVPDYTAPRLISSLYSDGVLERDEYDLLVKYLPISSSTLEFRSQIDQEDLGKLQVLARRLMTAQNEAYAL